MVETNLYPINNMRDSRDPSSPTEEAEPEFQTPATTTVNKLPPTEREKAKWLAKNLEFELKKKQDDLDWAVGNHKKEIVCGVLEDKIPDNQRRPSLSSSGHLTEDADELSSWVKPDSPLKLHHDELRKLHTRFAQSRTASSTSGMSAKTKSNTTSPLSLNSLEAQRGQRNRQRRPTLHGVFSSPELPVTTPSKEMDQRPREPILEAMVSSAAVLPSPVPGRLVRPRSRKPALKTNVSASAVPTTTVDMREKAFPRRPTMADVVLGGLPSPPARLAGMPRAVTYDASGAVGDSPHSNEYHFQTKPVGNAFARPGFWADMGLEEPKPKPVERNRDALLQPRGQEGGGLRPDDLEDPVEIDQPLGSSVFSTPGFLESMGRRLDRYLLDESHPFPQLELPTDSASREAYNQVFEALTAYWFSTKILEHEMQDVNISQDTVSAKLSSPPSPGSSLSTSTRESPLRNLPLGTLIRPRPTLNIPHSSPRTIVSASSASPKTKKRKHTDSSWEQPTFDKSIMKAYEITKLVLDEMEEQFGTTMFPSLVEYVFAKPQEVTSRLELFDTEEARFIKDYVRPSPVKTRSSHSRAASMASTISIEARDPNGSRLSDGLNMRLHIDKPQVKVLEFQRSQLQLLHDRQKTDALRVFDPGLRIIWATRFMEWAKDKYDQEMIGFEERLAIAHELKQLHDEMGLDVSDYSESDSEGAESSDEGFTYPSFIHDIHRQGSVEGMQRNTSKSPSPPSPTPRAQLQRSRSDIEARQRRRRTQLNDGQLHSPDFVHSPDMLPRPPPVFKRGSSASVDDNDWLDVLNAGLAKEKERQIQEQQRMGRRRSLRALREDPIFEFDPDGGSPRQRREREEHQQRPSSGFEWDFEDKVEGEFSDRFHGYDHDEDSGVAAEGWPHPYVHEDVNVLIPDRSHGYTHDDVGVAVGDPSRDYVLDRGYHYTVENRPQACPWEEEGSEVPLIGENTNVKEEVSTKTERMRTHIAEDGSETGQTGDSHGSGSVESKGKKKPRRKRDIFTLQPGGGRGPPGSGGFGAGMPIF